MSFKVVFEELEIFIGEFGLMLVFWYCVELCVVNCCFLGVIESDFFWLFGFWFLLSVISLIFFSEWLGGLCCGFFEGDSCLIFGFCCLLFKVEFWFNRVFFEIDLVGKCCCDVLFIIFGVEVLFVCVGCVVWC